MCIRDSLYVVPISINVSVADIETINVPEFLQDLIIKYGLTPEMLLVEITETDVYKRQIQRHQNLNCIYDHTCQFSSLHGSKYNASSTDQRDQKYNRVHHELQDRRVPCNDFFCFCKQGIYIIGHTVKFVYLVIFSYKCLYHT